MTILALNAGSSSLKFRIAEPGQAPMFTGTAQDFGTPDAGLEIRNADAYAIPSAACASLPDAARAVLDFVDAHKLRLSAIGHRIVHGGPRILAHCVIDKNVEEALRQGAALRPPDKHPVVEY